ncbi:hypothetical protein AB6E04_19285, partial [Vibrio amylolyticus]|uniref:hypothetical protein n=1 Tax=Vibrio amylolyticus TaxID=2847292 RepID=UPI00354B9907
MFNMRLIEWKLAKRFKKEKIVLTRLTESVECIPYPRGTLLKKRTECGYGGVLAEWLCSGLQIRGPRF